MVFDRSTTTLNFLDLETTGVSFYKDRIIDVYIAKTIGETVTKFQTLVNPGFRPDPYILRLTGINPKELDISPRFEEIVDDLYEFLGDDPIVAHNARFDYGFLKAEFKKHGVDYNPHYFCTVKLSRQLYPDFRKHNLDSIIERLNFQDGDRHRAEYDTEVIRHFFFHAHKNFEEDVFNEALTKAGTQMAKPIQLMNFDLDIYPNTPGVYIFKNKDNFPLYIGMSKNIQKRIKEHFYNNAVNSKEYQITSQTHEIDYIETVGELGARIRESILIKKHQPLYNRALRKNKSLVKVRYEYNVDGYIKIKEVTETEDTNIEGENLIGIYGNTLFVKSYLNGISKKFGLCPILLGVEKGKGACFSSHLGVCKGACVKRIPPEEYNELFRLALSDQLIIKWPFDGKYKLVEENNNGREEFYINKWIIEGSNKDSGLIQEGFDLDLYRIFLTYFKNDALEVN